MSIQACVFIVTIYVSVSYVSSEQGNINPLTANSNLVENSTEPTPSVQGEILAEEEFLEPTPPPSPPPPSIEFRKPPPPPSLLDEVIISPVLSNLKPVEILNRASIRIDGFDHLHRRTVKHVAAIEEKLPGSPQEPPTPVLVTSNVGSEEVDHIHRRSVEQVTEVVAQEELLPVEHKPRKIRAVEEFDLSPPESSEDSSIDDNGSGSGDGDDTSILFRSAMKKDGSDVSLTRGPGLLHGLVSGVLQQFNQVEQENGESSRHSISEMIGNQDERDGLDQFLEMARTTQGNSDDSWWSSQWTSEMPEVQEISVSDEDGDEEYEESTMEPRIPAISTEKMGVESDVKILNSFSTVNPITEDEVSTARPKEQSTGGQSHSTPQPNSSHIRHNSTSSNSTGGSRFQGPLVHILRADGPLGQFINKHAAVLVGIMMAIPAMIILLYFIHVRRRRGYTGSLYVSPTSMNLLKKKKSRNGVTFCSYENEMSMAPSTSSTPPKPPPLPMKN